jgi:hypothetical protein
MNGKRNISEECGKRTKTMKMGMKMKAKLFGAEGQKKALEE